MDRKNECIKVKVYKKCSSPTVREGSEAWSIGALLNAGLKWWSIEKRYITIQYSSTPTLQKVAI